MKNVHNFHLVTRSSALVRAMEDPEMTKQNAATLVMAEDALEDDDLGDADGGENKNNSKKKGKAYDETDSSSQDDGDRYEDEGARSDLDDLMDEEEYYEYGMDAGVFEMETIFLIYQRLVKMGQFGEYLFLQTLFPINQMAQTRRTKIRRLQAMVLEALPALDFKSYMR